MEECVGREKEREREREHARACAHMHVGERVREKALWLHLGLPYANWA